MRLPTATPSTPLWSCMADSNSGMQVASAWVATGLGPRVSKGLTRRKTRSEQSSSSYSWVISHATGPVGEV